MEQAPQPALSSSLPERYAACSELPSLLYEIRIIIWNLHLTTPHIVTLNHDPYNNGTSAHISFREKCPPLLHVSRETRYLALLKYGLIAPTAKLKGWGFPDYKTRKELLPIQKRFGLESRGPVWDMNLNLIEYMNNHPEHYLDFTQFAEYSTKNRPVISPCWFNIEQDILFVMNIQESFLTSFYPQKQIGRRHITFNQLSKLKHLAVEWSDGVPGTQDEHQQQIYNICNRAIPMPLIDNNEKTFLTNSSLEKVTLLLPKKCEVVVFTATARKSPYYHVYTQWSFFLDTESQEFQTEMGEQWSGVTWRVNLKKQSFSKPERLELLLGNWHPYIPAWEQQKWQLCMDNSKVGSNWKVAQNVLFPAKFPAAGLVLDEDGDGRTYRGPCWDPNHPQACVSSSWLQSRDEEDDDL